MSNVRVYGCGGCGVNLVTKTLTPEETGPGYAKMNFTIVDTSSSNLDKNNNPNVGKFLVPGMDGTGKDRAFAKKMIEPHINAILEENTPGQFNIVIFSLSGGTGSVAGPLLIREMINRGIDVVGIAVGNTSNGKEAENSLKGVGTLQGLSSKLSSSMVVEFHWIDANTSMNHADEMIARSVRALSILNSGKNHAMDSKDIHNWLNFHKHTTVPPQLVEFFIAVEESGQERNITIPAISTASLLLSKEEAQLELNQPYGCTGWLAPAVVEGSTVPKNVHFILAAATLNDTISKVAEIVDRMKKAEQQLATSTIIRVDGADDDGFCL